MGIGGLCLFAAIAATGCSETESGGGGGGGVIVLDGGSDDQGEPMVSNDAGGGDVDLGPEPDAAVEPEPDGVGVLGHGQHTLSAVNLSVIATADDGLDVPRALDFNPERPGELWVVNRADDSTTIITSAGMAQQTTVHLIDPFALHFMEEVSSIAFGAPMTFGTCQESRNTYNGQAPANDFTGPSLWPADPTIYARSNPAAVRANGGADLGSHLDMLHQSPLCMGIAWEKDNVYWVFEGLTSSILRADFHEDHGPGFDDHSDGEMWRYAEGQVQRVPDVPSHLAYDAATGMLYIADTGNGRVGMLDTRVGMDFQRIRVGVMEPGTRLYRVADGARVQTLGTSEADLEAPSGLELMPDGTVLVSDNATGRIWAYNAAGEVIDWLDTELPEGALMGMTLSPEGDLYFVDAVGDRVLRLQAP